VIKLTRLEVGSGSTQELALALPAAAALQYDSTPPVHRSVLVANLFAGYILHVLFFVHASGFEHSNFKQCIKFIVYVPVPDYVTVRRNRKIRTSLYIKQKMLILGRVPTYVA
jgi:hypothetical protein